MRAEKSAPGGGAAQKRKRPSKIDLEDRIRQSSLLLGGTLAVSIIGLTATTLFATWPWDSDDVVLPIFLCLMLSLLSGYVAGRRKEENAMRRQMERLERGAADRRYTRLFELLDITRIMDSERGAQSVFEAVPQVCLEIFNCEKASLMLVADNRHLEVVSAIGYVNRNIIGARQKIGEGISGWVAQHRKPVLIQGRIEPGKYPGLTFKARGLAAAVVVPIVKRDELVGVINISTRSPQIYYDDEDLRAIQAFADNVGACVLAGMKAKRMSDTIEEQQRELQKLYVTQP
jgi:transcriptional regulator with GAF, ATPase, and Fis domain